MSGIPVEKSATAGANGVSVIYVNMNVKVSVFPTF
jgi:hypothetical protein